MDSWWKLVPVESKKGAHLLKAEVYLVIKLHMRPKRGQGLSGRENIFQRVQSVTDVEEENLMRMHRLVAWEQGRNRVHSAAQSHVPHLSSICAWLILTYICMYVAIHIYIHTYIHTYVYTYVHAYIHTHTYIYNY